MFEQNFQILSKFYAKSAVCYYKLFQYRISFESSREAAGGVLTVMNMARVLNASKISKNVFTT